MACQHADISEVSIRLCVMLEYSFELKIMIGIFFDYIMACQHAEIMQ